MTTTSKDTAAKPQSKNLSPRQRLEGIKALVRYSSDEKKRLGGRVSEAQTEFKNLMKGEIPQTHEGCVQRLKDLQVKYAAVDERKDERSSFKRKQKEAEYQLLFEDIREGKQVELPGVETVITFDSLQHLKAATAATIAADKARPKDGEEDEDAPKLPPPADLKVLADLDAALEGYIAEAKLSPAVLPTDAQAVHPDEQKPAGKRGKPAVNAAPPVH